VNILNRDTQQLLDRARHAGCLDQVRKMIDGAVWSNWGPALRRKINGFIRSREEEQHPIGIINRPGESAKRSPLLPQGSWGERKEKEHAD